MGINRFLKTESDRIFISGGDWIEVKKDLDTGDSRRLEECGKCAPVMIDDRLPNGKTYTRPFYPIDWSRYELERAMIWLTDWSFQDANQKSVALSIDALRALDTETFAEISEVLSKRLIEVSEKKTKLREERMKTASPQNSEDVALT